jgi:hypothetical protein
VNDIIKYQNQGEIESRGHEIFEAAKQMKINSQLSYEAVVEHNKNIKRFIEGVIAFMKPMKQKTHEAHRAVCDQEKILLEPFQKADSLERQRMRGWYELQKKKAEEKRAAVVAAAEEKGEEPPPPPVVSNKAKVDGVAYQENYEVTLVDWDKFVKAVAAGKLPRNFILVQLGEVKRYANNTKGQMEIPGVHIERKDIPKVSK